MGSKRLPGKMMLDLYGEPIIYRILIKLTEYSLVNRVILTIPKLIWIHLARWLYKLMGSM